jgi:hypothetical protein
MRIVLTTALLAMAAIAWADEPSAPDQKAEAKAEATTEATTEATADATADKGAAQANAAVKEERRFKPPTGYRPKRVNGAQVYCTNVKVTGSRFAKEDCRTEAQLRDIEAQKASMRTEMDQIKHVCGSSAGCANN